MKPKNIKLATGLAIAAFVAISLGSADAAVTITHTGSRNNDFPASPVSLASLDFSSLSTTANTAVFFIYVADANLAGSATFAGQAMTIVTNGRVMIGYLTNPTNKTGTILLTAGSGNSSDELAYWGLAQGIDTTDITTAAGTTKSGTVQTNATLPTLNVGDVVLSGFAVNNFEAAAYSGGLINYNGSGVGYDGIITTNTVGTAGSFAASTTVASGATNAPAGVSIAFTAIVPEPGATILGSLGVLFLLRRRRA